MRYSMLHPPIKTIACFVLWIGLLVIVYHFGRPIWFPRYVAIVGGRTVDEAVADFGRDAEKRLESDFRAADVRYPPEKITLIALKEERVLELWAVHGDSVSFVTSYPFTAFSGNLGPKLREGDRQIPEGIYRIEGLNPNSRYHLSMKIDYPNEFDRKMAVIDGRTRLGGNIFIHGKSASIGCIAIGDPAIEELFILVAKIGRRNVTVIIAPRELRKRAPPTATSPTWLPVLYEAIRLEMAKYPLTEN